MNFANLHWPSSVPRLLWIRRECPLCSSIEFQTADSRALDRVLRLMAFCPVRCANCWRRYYCFGKRNRGSADIS